MKYLLLLSLLTTGCSSAGIKKYNESLEDFRQSIDNPSNPEKVKEYYFRVVQSPEQTMYPFNAVGTLFDQCSKEKK